MKQKFYVDWSDPAYLEIRSIEDASEYADPITLTEAKQEIIDHHRALIDHSREQIRITREVRAANIVARGKDQY
jgi:hypothetical protein